MAQQLSLWTRGARPYADPPCAEFAYAHYFGDGAGVLGSTTLRRSWWRVSGGLRTVVTFRQSMTRHGALSVRAT
jgi:hypothetical protein